MECIYFTVRVCTWFSEMATRKKTVIIIGTSRAYSEFYLFSVVFINENIPHILFKAQRVKVETTF